MQNVLVKRLMLSCLLAVSLTGAIWATDFKVDPTHSSVGFSIKHMFTNVTGQFSQFNGRFSHNQKTKKLSGIDFTITSNSLNTQNQKRDDHLRSADFFDTALYPTITFKGSSIKSFKGKYDVSGILTLHGVSKEVTFKAVHLGSATNPWGQETTSYSATAVINRKDFGMSWNKELDKGGLLIGNNVTITVELETAPIKEEQTADKTATK